MGFFRKRRTARQLDSTLWPETGESWSPDGVTVKERYYNLAHAVILVFTSDDPTNIYCTVACLGCHFVSTGTGRGTYHQRHNLNDAAEAANAHATSCHALRRDLPARPDDDTVRERLHQWASSSRRMDGEIQLFLSDLDPSRLTMQRTSAWIETALQQLATDQPDLMRAEHCGYSGRLLFHASRRPN